MKDRERYARPELKKITHEQARRLAKDLLDSLPECGAPLVSDSSTRCQAALGHDLPFRGQVCTAIVAKH